MQDRNYSSSILHRVTLHRESMLRHRWFHPQHGIQQKRQPSVSPSHPSSRGLSALGTRGKMATFGRMLQRLGNFRLKLWCQNNRVEGRLLLRKFVCEGGVQMQKPVLFKKNSKFLPNHCLSFVVWQVSWGFESQTSGRCLCDLLWKGHSFRLSGTDGRRKAARCG